MSEAKKCIPRNVANEPWYDRLYHNKTMSSTIKYVNFKNPEAPLDKLDFALKSVYDQEVELINGKPLPPLTTKDENELIVRNKVVGPEAHSFPKAGRSLIIWNNPTKDSVHKADNAICGHHSQETNAGYSRKPNGGHFMN
uniref:Uncharacterized protein n=1 Tax=Trichobilharzia regenti TaxID=157069 RepID=A0AA85JR58_TRIRE|nr:unnamed protein product [Trichobilharzia regenti]